MSAYLRGAHGGAQEFAQLKSRMEAALDALPAWPELHTLFHARYAHVKRLLYGPTCYDPLPPGVCAPQPQFPVEDRVAHLEELVTEGRLTERAALRAAEVIAIQAEYLAQESEINELPPGERQPALDELNKRYCNGTLEAGPAAELAGQRLAELTVDKLGWLAGPPRTGEAPPVATCYDIAAPPPP